MSRAARGGTHPLQAVYDWEERLLRHYKRGEGDQPGHVSINLNGAMGHDESLVMDGAFARMELENNIVGAEAKYWRLWARWFLGREGLPAQEDYGVRKSEGERDPRLGTPNHVWYSSAGAVLTYDDTPANHLLRAGSRFESNSAEGCAARIEWHFLTGLDGGGEVAVAHFVGFLEALRLIPDARTGRKVREGGRKGGTNPKFKRTTAADLVKGWRLALVGRKDGTGGPSAEARWVKRHCATASELSEETIRRYLGRFRKLGQKGA